MFGDLLGNISLYRRSPSAILGCYPQNSPLAMRGKSAALIWWGSVSTRRIVSHGDIPNAAPFAVGLW